MASNTETGKQYYNQKGKFGFIYRKVEQQKLQLEKECSTAGLARESQPVLLSNNERETLQSGDMHLTGAGQVHNVSNSQPHINGSRLDFSEVCVESDKVSEGEKDVEMQKLTAELMKICTSEQSGKKSSSTADIESVMNFLAQDLKKSDLYYRYLQAPDPIQPPSPGSLSYELKERVDVLQATFDLYKQEMKAWDEMTEQKRLGVEDAKSTFESERDVDFSQLHCEDVDTLKSYLTPEQTSILKQPVLSNPEFCQQAEKHLETINSRLDVELKRIQARCRDVKAQFKMGTTLDMSLEEGTPRALFKSLKNHA